MYFIAVIPRGMNIKMTDFKSQHRPFPNLQVGFCCVFVSGWYRVALQAQSSLCKLCETLSLNFIGAVLVPNDGAMQYQSWSCLMCRTGSLLSACNAVFTEQKHERGGLNSSWLFTVPVVTMPPHLRNSQDFLCFIKFVDFRVSFSLVFLYHLAPRVLGDFLLDWTDRFWVVELLSPRPFQVVPITLLSSFSHRINLMGVSRQISLTHRFVCLCGNMCVWPCVDGVN